MNQEPFDLKSNEVEISPVLIGYADDKITTFFIVPVEGSEKDSKAYTVPTSEILPTSQVKRQGQVGTLSLTLKAAYTAKVFDYE